MGVVSKSPSLERILAALENRIRNLERNKRFTTVAVNGVANAPAYPQSGDMMVDTTTGIPYIFMVDGNTTTTGSFTYTTNTTYTVAVAERLGFKPSQSVKITLASGVSYWAVIANTYSPASGAGTVPVTFPTITVPSGWTVPANPTVFAAGTVFAGSSWRQIVTASDLIAKGVLSSAAGGNAALGATTGGLGEVLGSGYPPS